MNRKTLLLVAVPTEGGLFLLGLLLVGGPQALASKFHLSWNATASAFLLCLPMLAALYFAVRSNWAPLSQLRAELDEKVTPLFVNLKISDLALIALLAGAGEEFFFRGWLQGTLTDKFEVWIGIAIASVIFGLAHYLSPTYAIYAGLTGIYLGVIYQVSGNLYIVMLIHAFYDFIALVYLVRRGKNDENRFEQLKNGNA
jgi:membrane protease YdiL (CAAX protease family)